ncbi:MAG TPA: TdeIII family type II restriction endonuclease [Bacteroidales bacterium]|nr:TdeIII family type II restriction endonuclease [Bacteroidales bacterium]
MINSKKEKISIEVVRTLFSQFEKFPDDFNSDRNAPFQDAFLNAFTHKLENVVQSNSTLISLASWIHGLNTSLGQSFIEKTAHILSDGCKKEFTTRRGTNLLIAQSQKNAIGDYITELSNGTVLPNAEDENKLCMGVKEIDVNSTDFTADVYIEDEENIICLEIKTVKPNKGIFKNEKLKILEAKAALANANPNKKIIYYLGFPFDPEADTPTGYDKERFLRYSVDFKKYFGIDDFLIAEEMWSFLSGEDNSMKFILDIINSIATPNFMDEYNFLQNKENRNLEEFKSTLLKWNMFTELSILDATAEINKKAKTDKRVQRIMNQDIFRNGSYNDNRKELLNI